MEKFRLFISSIGLNLFAISDFWYDTVIITENYFKMRLKI